jgi:endonuclease/exonuclease/phosphatase family metal-dependent hydrolase
MRHPLSFVAKATVLATALAAVTAPGLAATPARPAAQSPGTTLRLATWNLEWLLTPEAFAQLAPRCTSGSEPRRAARSIPCDVAAGEERSASDYAGLARYARMLDADVVALQEVDGIPAARQVFPGYNFCFTGGPAVQNTGFAVRPGIPYRCEPDLRALSLGDTLRRGAVLVLYPATPRELHLLGVHLKSGCPRASLAAAQAACTRLRLQLPALADWIGAEQSAGQRYALLGDFNRDLQADARAQRRGRAGGAWAALQASAGGQGLHNTAEGQAHANCRRGQLHAGFIDYILLGGALAAHVLQGSYMRLTYQSADAWRLKLSDHCPVALTLRLD